MSRYLEMPDRSVRQTAWELVAKRRLTDRGPIDDIFDKMIATRTQIGKNADFDNFRDYQFRALRAIRLRPRGMLCLSRRHRKGRCTRQTGYPATKTPAFKSRNASDLGIWAVGRLPADRLLNRLKRWTNLQANARQSFIDSTKRSDSSST